MPLELVKDFPPMWDEIAKAFPVKGKPVLFAWENRIYAPCGVSRVSPQLNSHEHVHCQRQSQEGGPHKWWRRYIDDPAFRLDEEKLAHAAEFMKLWEVQGGSRAARRTSLSIVAARLSAPIYRYRFTKAQAREYLENGNF